MPGPGKHHQSNHKFGDNSVPTMNSVTQEIAVSFPADSPVLAVFRDAAKNLNERNERHDRLVKLSCDVTIECKRIISLLHSPITTDSSGNRITKAKKLIQFLINAPIKNIGLVLEHCPAHLHTKIVTESFQEYVKARIMLSVMAEKRIITYPEIQKELEYTIIENDIQRLLVTMIPHSDYMLGLADVSGELMRKAINSISSGDTEECFEMCYFLRLLYSGYLGISDEGHLSGKLPVIRANLEKVEQAVYALRMRGRFSLVRPITPTSPDTTTAGWDWEAPLNQFNHDEGYN